MKKDTIGERPPAEGWESAVAEASAHVEERGAAAAEAAERQRPKAEGPRIAAAAAALALVVAWNAWAWTRPPEPTPIAVERAHLAWMVGDAVEEVDDFRAREGRLPTEAEMAALLEDDVTYRRAGEGFAVTGSGDGAEVSFDGSVPLADWVELHAGAPARTGEGS